MTNQGQAKRKRAAADQTGTIRNAISRLSYRQIKYFSKRFLSAFLIYALVFLPLLSSDGIVQKAHGQIIFNCSSAPDVQFIFQKCPLDGTLEYSLTEQAIDDVMALYELPASSRELVKKHARNEIRSMLYIRLLQLINKPSPTSQEQQAIAAFTRRIKEKRIESAQLAKAEYNRFQTTNCRIYQPPLPYTYNAGYGCYSPLAGFFSSSSPSYEEFQNFGAVLAYGDLVTPEAQAVSTQTTQGIVAGAGIAAAGIGAGAAAAIGSTITFGTLSAILPAAGVTFSLSAYSTGAVTIATLPAAGAASGSIGASAAAGPAAIIILAVTAAVMEGINVANQAQLPGKLDQAIIDKQNETIDVRALTNGDDARKQEVYGAFLRITLPEFPDEETIAPSADDPIFTFSTPTTPATDSTSMTYTPWAGQSATENNEARLFGSSWFLVHNGSSQTPYRMRLSINFQGENGELLTARRRGRQFIVTKPENPSATVVTETLKARFANIVYTYKVKPSDQQLAAGGFGESRLDCFTFSDQETGELYTDVSLGEILNTGGTSAAALQLFANDGATATVGSITLKNLRVEQVNGTNLIRARAVVSGNAYPESASFTIKVVNNTGDTQTFVTTVKRTAVTDTLPKNLPADLTVGTNYSFELSTNNSNIFLSQCSGFSYSLTEELPSGLTFVNNHPAGAQEPFNSDVRIAGTAGSDGDYQFTINKNYLNGEVLSRTYRMTAHGDLAEIPAGVKSWWRAENNAEDFTNRAGGTMAGSTTFINGKVSRGFYFRGTDGYVQLPDNAFQIASGAQTFETWFKTGANGVILGRQNGGVTPFGSAQNISRPLIYVDKSGRLHAGFGETAAVSSNAVNNNSFHHVAVTYSESGGGAVYLDGVSIGSNSARAFSGANQKFQFGTGYVNPGASGELSGWSNFTGTIDEPAVYDQILSAAQIKAIYAAGAGGKISVSAVSTPPTQRDGNNGTITISAQGGVRQLRYSINNGATFQTTNFFQNLTPGTYQTIVRDGGDRDVRRTVVINNPAPNLSLTTEVMPPPCYGGNARLVIYPSGGSSANNYEYSVRGGANVQASNVFTDIGAGTYTPWIRDVASDTVYTGGPVNIPQPAEIIVSPARFANAALNQPYSQTFTVSGGTPGYSVGVSGDVQTNFQLPAGLTSNVSGNVVTISGTPAQTGSFNMFFEIYDQNSCRQGVFVPFVITSNQTYNIAGRVTNGGQPLSNVTLTLAGAENRTAVTDTSGNYSFTTVAGGADYTITASLNGYAFAQPTISYNNLNANLTGANFATAVTTYEGDIAGRPSGDGEVNVLDLVSLGRMINNLDAPPAYGAEYQRTDIAPRSGLGNGVIDVQDLNQLRNYIVATNPKTPSSGAVTNAAAFGGRQEDALLLLAPNVQIFELSANGNPPAGDSNQTSLADPARVSAGSVGVSGGVFMPITLNSAGNVSAIQFTITYDANKLSPASISAGANAPSNLTLVTNKDSFGLINVVAYLPQNGTAVFPAGDVQLLRINFSLSQGAAGSAVVSFADAPTARLAADPAANAITLNSSPGAVMITPTAAGASITGKVLTATGKGVANARVILIDGKGQTKSVMTTAFGNFIIEDVTVGETVIININAKRYTFAPQVVSVTENVLGLTFTAQ